MRRVGFGSGLVVGLVAVVLLATACGGSSGSAGDALVDLSTFIGGPAEHLDPALDTSTTGLVGALYDGLTDLDYSDPAHPLVKPLLAESFQANADASEWTFKIRKDMTFSNGEQIKPSSFVRAWERASDPDFAGNYSYLFNFIEGGKAKLDGAATSLAGVEGDDDSMTLRVKLSAPYSNFATVAGFQLFAPMPSAVDKLKDQADWENGLMIGNGPYKLASPRTDAEVVLIRNDKWAGDVNGNKWPDRVSKITFRVSADPDTAYNAFEAGEGDMTAIPPGRTKDAEKNYATTSHVDIAGVYYFAVNQEDPVVGGPKNVLLRRAISQAIDRGAINEAIYDGNRADATGVTPAGIPGHKPKLCTFCALDRAAAKLAFDQWKAAGNTLRTPLKIQFNAGAGHEELVQMIVDNLKAIGIEAEAESRPGETYFSEVAQGKCQICRSGWFADYPAYDNFMFDLFHSDSIGGNNEGRYHNAAFDGLVDEAKRTVDPARQAGLFQQAEELLLNTDMAAIPINFYKGGEVYNPKKIASLPIDGLGKVAWEQVKLRG